MVSLRTAPYAYGRCTPSDLHFCRRHRTADLHGRPERTPPDGPDEPTDEKVAQ
jgi:hypothetical protein